MPGVILLVFSSLVAYTFSLAFCRLFFHPLARIPGPKPAAITRLHEAYYDVYKKGQYTFKIRELHAKYGPVIRISPHEVHVHDVDFFDKLYRNDGGDWQKYSWAWGDALDNHVAMMHTVSHDLHRQRRAATNTFFPKANVHRRHEIIQKHLQTLCDRLARVANESPDIFMNIGGAVTALTYDVVTDFVLGKSYGVLLHPEFNLMMTGLVQSNGSVWRIAKHVKGFMRLLKSMPPSFVEKNNPQVAEWFKFVKFIQKKVFDSAADHSSSKTRTDDAKDDVPPTLTNAILDSKLPIAEKDPHRMLEEISVILGAGGETTANALRVILYHIYKNSQISQKLRTELESAGVQGTDTPIGKLEQLPYLTAVLTEGLRLSPGVATRSARLAPDRPLVYDNKIELPAGTPISMTVINLHMDKNIHPRPQTFHPERWLGGNKPFFAPFSKGTRICLGMHLAWAELYSVIAALIVRFDFVFEDSVGPQDIECVSDNLVIGTKRINGMKARVLLR